MSKHTPFKFILRKRIKFFVLIVVILSFVFIIHQLFYFTQLNDELLQTPANLIRGIHFKHVSFYVPNNMNQFTCIHSKEMIDFKQVNDDYCDCLDGTDEPGTNACSDGIFYCLFQDPRNRFHRSLPSTMVNDGICDCCDGSDEWNAEPLPFRLDDLLQRKLGRYQTPCPNICNQ